MSKTQARRRGRPSNFPNQETVAFLAKIPVATKGMVEQLAEKRSEPIGVTLDRMIQNAFKQANRSRPQKAS